MTTRLFCLSVLAALFFATTFAFSAPTNGYRLCKSGSSSCASNEGYRNGSDLDNVVAWCTCKRIKSTCDADLFIPTMTADSWDTFIAQKPPCVAIVPCTKDPTTQTISATGSPQAVNVPAGCGFVSVVAKGAGGGGGSGQNPGAGGTGGQTEITKATVSTGYTVRVGGGGKAGKCNSSAPGTSGGFPGMDGGATLIQDGSGSTILVAGGGGGGSDTGTAGVSACKDSSQISQSSAEASEGITGLCYGGASNAATGGAAGKADGGCGSTGDGTNGSVTFTFSR